MAVFGMATEDAVYLYRPSLIRTIGFLKLKEVVKEVRKCKMS